MIHYHGAPLGNTKVEAAKFFAGRHAMVSFAHPGELPVIADVCQSFVLDNGAFTTWKRGKKYCPDKFYEFVSLWYRHPAFEWALIPDVIDGDEDANNELLEDWPEHLRNVGVPVWHLHESIGRLCGLAFRYPRVALGSSGQYRSPGTQRWWQRIGEALDAITPQGRPVTKLHGLRMLDPRIFSQMPLASADSTNAVLNHKYLKNFGMYPAPTPSARAEVIAQRVESFQSAPVWAGMPQQEDLLGCA